ncbi:hypothetical protein [Eisenbergiella tayi]|uniref:hypothetical protein n=1 Tax=Eisenbergiella tayi TaxID=1432052 RepID=UPI00307C4C14
MEEELKRLSVGEEEQIRTKMFLYFADCPCIPDGVSKKYGEVTSDSIGFFSRQGSGAYTKKYVSGTFEADYPFFLRYRAQPTNNNSRLRAEEILTQIAEWMCTRKNYPVLEGNRTVENIEAGNAYIVAKSDDGSIDYQVNMTLNYMKKGR